MYFSFPDLLPEHSTQLFCSLLQILKRTDNRTVTNDADKMFGDDSKPLERKDSNISNQSIGKYLSIALESEAVTNWKMLCHHSFMVEYFR